MTRFLITWLSLLTFACAAQAGRWNAVQSKDDADTVWVTVTLDVALGCSPTLGCGGTEFATLRVTPCPLHKACVGGEYQQTLTSDIFKESIELGLAKGTAYTFMGSWGITRMTIDPYLFDCSALLCEQNETLTPSTFPDAVPVEPVTWGRIKAVFE
ncbi:MAG: hypothetical protein V3V49_06665 [Candidatus Krumholzibacteria bacterium]